MNSITASFSDEKKRLFALVAKERGITENKLILSLIDDVIEEYQQPVEWRIVKRELRYGDPSFYMAKIRFDGTSQDEIDNWEEVEADTLQEVRDLITEWYAALDKPVVRLNVDGKWINE